MTSENGQDPPGAASDQRRRQAQERWRALEALDFEPPQPGESVRLVHELRTHHIELEAQNEELRQAQDALQASKARYFDLYEMAPVGYVTLNRQGMILEANLTAAGLFGVVKSALLKRPLSQFIDPGYQDGYYACQRRLFSGEGPQSYECRLRHGGGGWIWARLEAILVWDGAAGADCCRAVLSDITASKRAEEQAARSRERMRAIVDTASSGIITIDQRGVIVTLNSAAARLFGYAEEELAGRNVSALMPSPDRERHDGYIAAYLQSGTPKIIGTGRDVLGRRKDGSTFPLNLGVGEFQEGGERFFTGIVQDITEKKRVDEQRAQLQRLIEHSGDFIAMADLDGNITYMNRAGRRMIGLAEGADPRRLRITDYTAPESLELVRTVIFPALWENGLWEGEMRWRRLGSGETIDVSRSIFVIRDSAGQAIGFATVTHDITRRKQAEAALHASEQQLAAMFRQSTAGLAQADLAGRFLLANDTFYALVGRSREELLGLRFQDITHPEDLPRNEALYIRCVAEGRDFVIDKRYLKPDGSPVWVRIHGSPIRGADGRVSSVMAAAFNITGIKRAEAALRESEAFARAVLNSVSAEIAVLDREGVIVAVNEPWRRFAGHRRADPAAPVPRTDVGVNYLAVCRDSAGDASEGAMAAHDGILAVLERQAPRFTLEYPCHSPDGQHWFAMTVTPLEEARGGAVVSHVEITERKQAERQLRERQSEAESYMRLYVANQTIAAIAHELNQPLNAIASYSAGALRLLKAGDPPREKLVQAFEQNAKQSLRAGQAIRELLAFLRGGETITQAVNLNELVCETLNRVRADSLLGNFKASLDLAEHLPPVQANRVQVEKVLVNLIRNGVEAMREAGMQAGAIDVTVRTCAQGRRAQVTVRDSGPGLPGESLRRVFEPFFTTKAGGLGMGLAISRALVEAQGGKLWAEREDGAGASFHFTLPLAAGE